MSSLPQISTGDLLKVLEKAGCRFRATPHGFLVFPPHGRRFHVYTKYKDFPPQVYKRFLAAMSLSEEEFLRIYDEV